MPVSMNGRSKLSSHGATRPPTSCPPSSTPRMIEAIVSPSIQPLALTSCDGGSSSVRMPYFAGEYAAAPRPTTRIRPQRMAAEQHQHAADHLDGVGDEHHAPFGHGVGERAHQRRQQHVEQREHRRQRRNLPGRRVRGPQQLDGADQQCVVSQRAEELRRHDGVEASFHALLECGAPNGAQTACSRGRRVIARGVAAFGARPALAESFRGIVLPRVSRLPQSHPFHRMPRPIEALIHR